jgi:hypothetical protein
MRRIIAITVGILSSLTVAAPAWACGGLVNPNGTVALLRTTTFVGYTEGVEHYVTSFEYAGGGAEFGSIVPLPGVPTSVERAGDWTLQRLVKEVTPVVSEGALSFDAAGAALEKAEVLLETRIDALDITVLKGGGDAVGQWALDNGFALTPDAPEMLDFYAARSPIFMAARFDPKAAENQEQTVGDGTPIHLTIPTPNPWVPLRILTLGLGDEASVEADVFLLTEGVPNMLPLPSTSQALFLDRSERASKLLLSDLRSDKGMEWIPADDMWFSYLRIDAQAGDLKHDLAIDATGFGEPSKVAAGLVPIPFPIELPEDARATFPWLLTGLAAGGLLLWAIKRSVWSA